MSNNSLDEYRIVVAAATYDELDKHDLERRTSTKDLPSFIPRVSTISLHSHNKNNRSHELNLLLRSRRTIRTLVILIVRPYYVS